MPDASFDHWISDVLGEPFEQLRMPLPADEEGEVCATLVRYRARRRFVDLFQQKPLAQTDVLFVHGWSDYFFNVELAEFWSALGANFYALDLRKYGRSLLPHQTPGYISDLQSYDEDIAAALGAIARANGAVQHPETGRKLFLMGHSTGGLTLSLWANRNPGAVDALILNSPWLEFQARSFGRHAITPIVELSSKLLPKEKLPEIDMGFYARTVSKEFDGEWNYDAQWKPHNAFATPVAWLKAVLDGHAAVQRGLQISAPILVLLSDKSVLKLQWDEQMASADSVLDVEVVSRRALLLGNTVTVVRIPDALHDIFLSRHPVRDRAYAEVTRWLMGYR